MTLHWFFLIDFKNRRSNDNHTACGLAVGPGILEATSFSGVTCTGCLARLGSTTTEYAKQIASIARFADSED